MRKLIEHWTMGEGLVIAGFSDNAEITFCEPNRIRRLTYDGSKFEGQTTVEEVHEWCDFILSHFDDSENGDKFKDLFRYLSTTVGVNCKVILRNFEK